MKCIIFGGSGEVGGAVVRALVASGKCTRVTMLGRRIVPGFQGMSKVEQSVVDPGAADFEEAVKAMAQGHDAAISCIGIGSGTLFISEERMMGVEVGMVGKFARGCKAAGIGTFELLTAWGINEGSSKSLIKPIRVMGKKTGGCALHRLRQGCGFQAGGYRGECSYSAPLLSADWSDS